MNLTAAEILSAMAGTYLGCRSYRDVGVHTSTRFPDERPAYTNVKPFATAFVRPDRFRFEYRHCFSPGAPEQRRVAWACGDQTCDYWDRGRGRCERTVRSSLPEALTALGGASGRLSWVVPFLLLPAWGDGAYWPLSELARLDDDRISDTDCYRVRGHFSVRAGHPEVCQRVVRRDIDPSAAWSAEVGPVTFWIEKERLLLRRFTDSGRAMNFRFENVADYQPEIGVRVTEAELAPGSD